MSDNGHRVKCPKAMRRRNSNLLRPSKIGLELNIPLCRHLLCRASLGRGASFPWRRDSCLCAGSPCKQDTQAGTAPLQTGHFHVGGDVEARRDVKHTHQGMVKFIPEANACMGSSFSQLLPNTGKIFPYCIFPPLWKIYLKTLSRTHLFHNAKSVA